MHCVLGEKLLPFSYADKPPLPPAGTCRMLVALQKSLELLTLRSTMEFRRTLPCRTFAPVLTVFRIHLVLSSLWNRWQSKAGAVRGPGEMGPHPPSLGEQVMHPSGTKRP